MSARVRALKSGDGRVGASVWRVGCAGVLAVAAVLTMPFLAAGSAQAARADIQATAEAPAAGPVVRLVFVGDVMLDDGPGATIAAGGDPLAALDAPLRAADFAIGNLECPVSARGTELANKIETFRADPSVMRVLKGRFAVLSVANNHAGDWGPEAFLDTIDHVRAAGIAAVGGGRDLGAAHAPAWLEKHGLRIAVLAYNEYKPRRFQAGPHWPGLAWSEDAYVIADIRAARAAGADIVIPFMHWGWENERAPDARQRQLAERMIAAGADAVVGTHPHVTQGADIVLGKPVIWSLGNFVFDGFDPGPGRSGWWLELTLDRHGVRRWATHEVQMDAAGTPHPVRGATPCGVRGLSRPMHCRDGEPDTGRAERMPGGPGPAVVPAPGKSPSR